jgi:anti-sigma B factor antagonist
MTRLSPLKEVSSDTGANGLSILTLDGEFDLASAPDIEGRLTDSLREGKGGVIVDLRGLTFLDSTVLMVLEHARAHAKTLDRKFSLVKPNSLVWRTFVLTGMHQSFRTFATLREATAGTAAAP